jgi:flagellar L-ring protein precursor FlgH
MNLKAIPLVFALACTLCSALKAQPPGGPPGGPPPGLAPAPFPPPGIVPREVVPPPVLPPSDEFFAPDPNLRMRDLSWTFIDVPEPRIIHVHDILTIVVDEKAELTANSRFNRTRNVSLKAELKEFMRINDEGNLGNAAENQPTIDAAMNERAQTSGQSPEQEGVRYRIAAMVVDIRPNGNLVLEARKSVRSNDDVWHYRLTGEVASDKVNRDGTTLSENVYNIDIQRDSDGKTSDSTGLKWGSRLYDMFFPF